jgi:hypothetical protein
MRKWMRIGAKISMKNAASYLRCVVARRYIRFLGPTLPKIAEILAEILAEIMLGAVPEMEVSHLLDILVGDVRNIDLLSVY